MKRTLRNPYVYLFFLLPSLVLYSMFFIYPMLTSSYYAFTNWNGLEGEKFIGLANFTRAFGDGEFRRAILNNFAFIGFSVFIQVPLIVFFALLISQVKRLQGLYKTTVFMPSILSTAVIGILWAFMYHPTDGPLNKILGLFGIETIYWLADTKWALLSVLIVNAWQWMGFFIVLILAAILSIPQELNDAAAIDGASGWQRSIHLTIPLLRPVISIVIFLSIAGAMKVVDIVLVMTKGGPIGSTEVMASYMVKKALGSASEYGYGMSLALIIFAFALVLTAIYQLLFGKHAEGNEY